MAVDGNNGTFWHTAWGNNEPQCPHTIVIDMAKIYNVTACTYLARQDGNQNGMVKGYEFYLSTDGKTWGQAVATGEFKNTTALQIAKLKKPTAGRYMKMVAKSEINGKAWTSAAEIGIQATADITAISLPTSKPRTEHAIYALSGQKVKTPDKRSAEGSLFPQGLKKGIYIQDGKKVLR